jgi:hypothetical protein
MHKWLSATICLGLVTELALWTFEQTNKPNRQLENGYWGADIPDDPEEKLFAVFDNGQLTYEDLKIGVGNFVIEEYVTDVGEAAKGMRCGLWLYLRGDPEEYTMQVYPGQVIEGQGYSIRIHSMIHHENDRWSLQLGLKKTSQSS